MRNDTAIPRKRGSIDYSLIDRLRKEIREIDSKITSNAAYTSQLRSLVKEAQGNG